MFRKVAMGRGVEQTVAPEGDGYHLVVSKVEAKETKKGDPMDVLTIRIVGADGQYSPFRHYITYPKADDSDDFVAMKAREIRRLCHLFGVDYSDDGFDPEDLAGTETTEGRLAVESFEKDDGTVIENNRLVLPRVQE